MLDAENPAGNLDPSESTSDDTGADAVTPVAPAAENAAAEGDAPAKKTAAKRSTAKKAPAKKAAAKKTAAKRTTKKVAASSESRDEAPTPAKAPGDTATEGAPAAPTPDAGRRAEVAEAEGAPENTPGSAADAGEDGAGAPPAKQAAKRTTKKAAAKRATKKAAAAPSDRAAAETAGPGPALSGADATAPDAEAVGPDAGAEQAAPAAETRQAEQDEAGVTAGQPAATALLFQAPDPTKAVVTRRRRATRPEAPPASEGAHADRTEVPDGEEREPKGARSARGAKKSDQGTAEQAEEAAEAVEEPGRQAAGEGEEEQAGERRRRRRGGRRRRRSGGGDENGSAEAAEGTEDASEETPEQAAQSEESEEASTPGSRRRRRRRRSGESAEGNGEEAETAPRARKPRNAEDEITAVTGSTRLEAKKQRRREGREAGRRRAPIVSEAEFLARRESVDRVMVIRQREDLTQIAVLEDKVLVEHYVSRESQTSLIGNVYLGRVQNVLPSMEAAFIDIGKGRNAVLYAGEVNWDALGAKNGSPRKIEAVLKSGQTVLVQVTKDPVGHKGARLTSQISLPGRFLVYVPDGTTSGISRKLPDTERNRLKNLLKDIVPDTAGVIVRTAAEGASEEELTRDVERLTARWADIEKKAGGGNAPQLLYGEPDLTLKVVRDLFTEDFNKLVISGTDAWDMVEGYVSHVAPDLADRLERHDEERDVFAAYRIDEQIEKALDRKVWLPSGGSLVIDRTEAMTVVDVNTGKFTGSGGNLEETVTKNNLEAAEEIVRQLRLRDIGGIIVVDFIDMVLESNRDLVLRRLVECLGRDRTRHQVAEVTSLGLVQMTRKRIGTGLLEAFSEACDHCQGRGLILHHEPVEQKRKGEEETRRARRGGRGRAREEAAGANGGQATVPSPKDIAAMAKHEERAEPERRGDEEPLEGAALEQVRESSPESAAAAGPTAAPEPIGEGEPAAAGTLERGRRGRGRGGRGRDRAASGPEAEAAAETQVTTEVGTHPDGQEPAGAQREVGTAGEVRPSQAGLFPRPGSEHRVEPSGETGSDGGAPEAAEAAEDRAAGEPPAVSTPRIVTTVRRRSARRPAGPPAAVAGQASTAATSDATTQSTTPADAAGPDGVRTDGDDAVDEPADVDALATLVDAAEEPPNGDAADPDEDSPGTPHVPVKRRGSRRR